jgi:hypothetical protein
MRWLLTHETTTGHPVLLVLNTEAQKEPYN